MIFSFIPAIASLAISVFVNPAMAHPAPGKPAFNSPEHLALIKDNYLDVWNGNLTLLNETFAPVLQFHGDRFPSGNTSTLLGINTREDFLAFVERARAGWDQYEFKVHAWVGHENHIAVRWIMDGILGQNYSLAPT
jgi:SnoaL-like domain